MNPKTKKLKKCKCCNHFNIKLINLRLIQRERTHETFAAIARDFQNISVDSLKRHSANCLKLKADGKRIIDSGEKTESAEDQDAMVAISEKQAWAMYNDAVAAHDVSTALKAQEMALKCLAIRHRMTDEGRIKDQEIVLSDTEEWRSLRDKLLKALEPYPDARAAILKAISSQLGALPDEAIA